MKSNKTYLAPELYVVELYLDSSILTSSSADESTKFDSDWTVSDGGSLGL
jgi:hypothetical protein